MPRVAPPMPRKMLPPPTTTAISTSSSLRALVISSAMRCTTAASMPYPIVVSANASPESLSTTRWYRLFVMGTTLFRAPRDSPWVYASPILTRAKRRTVASLPRPSTSLPTVVFGILHERLLEERDLLVEAVDPPFDDLRHRGLGLALVAAQLLEDRALLLEHVGRHVVAAHVSSAPPTRRAARCRARPPAPWHRSGRPHPTPRARRWCRARSARACSRRGRRRCVSKTTTRPSATFSPSLAASWVTCSATVESSERRARRGLPAASAAASRASSRDRVGELRALGHEVGLGGELRDRADPTLDDDLDGTVLGGAPGGDPRRRGPSCAASPWRPPCRRRTPGAPSCNPSSRRRSPCGAPRRPPR